MSESDHEDAFEEVSKLAHNVGVTLTKEEQRRLGRELLQMGDGLRLDHNNGRVIIGDTAVGIRALPDGLEGDSVTEYRYEFLDDHAEGWYHGDHDLCLELSWQKVDDE